MRAIGGAGDLVRFLPYLPALVLLGVGLALLSGSKAELILIFSASTATAFLAPRLALCVLMAWLPFSFRYILPFQAELQMPTEPITGVLALVFVMRLLARRLRGEADEVRSFPLKYPLLLYIASLFASLLNTPDLYISAKGAVRATAYAMLAFVFYDLIRLERDLRLLFLFSAPMAAAAVIWTVVVLAGRLELWRWTSSYWGTPFTNYSVYGSFVSVFLMLTLSRLLFDRSDYDRIGWGVLTAIFAVGLLFCFSRGVWVAAVLTAGAMLLHRSERSAPVKLAFLGGAALVAIALISIPGVFPALKDRVLSLFDMRFATNRMRLLRWWAAVMMFLRHPILGNGYGSFALLYKESPEFLSEQLIKYKIGAHNEYLQTLSETGLLGFGAWMWAIVEFYRLGLRSLRELGEGRWSWLIVGIMAAEGALLIHFVFNNLMAADKIAIPFWGLYGLLPAVADMMSKKVNATSGSAP